MSLSLFTTLGACRRVLPEQPTQVVPTRWAPAAPTSPPSSNRSWACNQAPPCEREQTRVRHEPAPHRQVRQLDPAGLPAQRSQRAHLSDTVRFISVIGQSGLAHLPSPECCEGPAGLEELPRPDRSGFRIDQHMDAVQEGEAARIEPSPFQAVAGARRGTEEGDKRGCRPEGRMAAMRHRVFSRLLERHLIRADHKRHAKRQHAPCGHPKRSKPSGSSDSVAPSHDARVYEAQR